MLGARQHLSAAVAVGVAGEPRREWLGDPDDGVAQRSRPGRVPAGRCSLNGERAGPDNVEGTLGQVVMEPTLAPRARAEPGPSPRCIAQREQHADGPGAGGATQLHGRHPGMVGLTGEANLEPGRADDPRDDAELRSRALQQRAELGPLWGLTPCHDRDTERSIRERLVCSPVSHRASNGVWPLPPPVGRAPAPIFVQMANAGMPSPA